jgi:NAD(P)H-dependent FMN reductase
VEKTKLAIIIGSTREGRFGSRVANWFAGQAQAHKAFEVTVIDLLDFEMPVAQAAGHPRMGQFPASLNDLSDQLTSADAFVFVTPEYNHGYPASLKSALDAFYTPWLAKPAAFVSYGGALGGVRAIEQLRQVVAELHMADIRESVSIPFIFGAFNEDGDLKDENLGKAAQALLTQLAWWSKTLAAGRQSVPYPN